MLNVSYGKYCVVIFNKYVNIAGSTKFVVDITNAGGEFEISESGSTVCTGHVYSPEESGKSCTTKMVKTDKKTLSLNIGDIYKELKLRGYEYGPTFQGVMASDVRGMCCILFLLQLKFFGGKIDFYFSLSSVNY